MGDYKAEELNVYTRIKDNGDTGSTRTEDFYMGDAKIISENGFDKLVYSAIRPRFSCESSPFWTKAGAYNMEVTISNASDNVPIVSLPLTLHIPDSSTLWSTTEQTVAFDGSQNVKFTLQNGTNYARFESIESVYIHSTRAVGTYLNGGVSFDPDSGTVEIDKDILKAGVQELKNKGLLINGNTVYIKVNAKTVEGDVTECNVIDYDEEITPGIIPNVTAWTIDISNLSLETPESIFSDVNYGDWYYDYVRYVKDRGLMTGLNETTFGPAESLYRAQFATIVYRMENSPEIAYSDKFPDVLDGQWYTDPVLWANEAGIVTGYSNTGYFGPADKINREQMAVMMYRYAKYKGYDVETTGSLEAFPDAAKVNDFAKDAIEWCVGAGIITGKDGKIDPQGEANRAECATIIMRFMEYYGI